MTTYIHWTLIKSERICQKLLTLIRIKLSRPNLEVEHVATVACPLMGPDFLKHLPRTSKTSFNIKIRFKNGHLNLYENMILKIN